MMKWLWLWWLVSNKLQLFKAVKFDMIIEIDFNGLAMLIYIDEWDELMFIIYIDNERFNKCECDFIR